MQQNKEATDANEELVLTTVFFHYLKYWRWFIVSIVICLLLSFSFLRYSTRQYVAYAKVLIKDNEFGRTAYDISAFSDLGLMSPVSNFDNEIEILNSETLIREVVDSLNLGVAYFKEGRVKEREIYLKTPMFVSVSNQINWGDFILDKVSDDIWSISSEKESFNCNFSINDEINSPWGILRFHENPYGSYGYPIKIVINHPMTCPGLEISPTSKHSSVAYITHQTTTPQKGIDIINTLLYMYNRKTIKEKNQVAYQTLDFIDERLVDISGELNTAEKKVELYKQEKELTDIETEARLFMSETSDYNKKISEAETQLNVLQSIKNYLLSPESFGDIVPANAGVTDPTILSLIKKYNEEVLEKNKITQGMTKSNPILKESEDRIALLKEELIKGIKISELGIQTVLQELQRQEKRYRGKAYNLSTQEREWGELARQKDIKETLFMYLLQKREETSLSLALSTPNAIIIDQANFNPNPVVPQSRIILLVALLVGLIIPALIIYIKGLFENKLQGKAQLEKEVKAPFLGEIPLSKAEDKFPVLKIRSRIAEKFRIITTHLNFVVNKENGTRVVMVTSTASGEGKSFFSKNLAMSLASTGKKTLLIDLDMRKSMMNETLEMNPHKGIAMFLSDPSLDLDEIIDKSGKYHKNLDIIPIKIFPPNPAELLLSDRLGILFEEIKLKGYDYVIVDTPPVGLVADAFRINQYVDATIYVTRADYTFKSSLSEIQKLYEDKRLGNMSLVINASQETPGQREHKHNYYVED
ncbi:polysaccharide biosynthesis tyrosine autokinase [Bacteroidales bacterium OttesenSCG-928-M06]|nr:polysaccharide biosynthesis tyrosine autokinase [Bacteroidales bacterium OttesenSCG-928-M06]